MIERVNLDGRIATVAYLKGDFVPADKIDATYVKVIYDDGEVAFAGYPKQQRSDRSV